MASLTERVKSLAREVGFHAVGITSPDPFLESEQVLRERYELGLLEGSDYDLDLIRLRTHPLQSLPNAKSILAVALSYLSDESDESDRSGAPKGRMARFSRGLDYHKVLQERLGVLAARIQAEVGGHAEVRSYADTGPIADRSAAIRAGIGSRGKNTCVSVGKYGSWVVLGELVTDIELEPDEPAPVDICGDCEECVRACPTCAISAPYTVDTRICLSQVTQSKGSIPHWLREKMGTRIYGCDNCQSECPLNRHAEPGNLEAFRPTAGLGTHPDLLSLLNIGLADFACLVHPTTAGWIRRTRFRRNVAVALGNIGDPIAVSELKIALADPAPIVRGHAAWALGRIGTGRARRVLESALCAETDASTLLEFRRALDIPGVAGT